MPRRSLLALVVERTRALAMGGRVTIGHVTTLAAMPADAQARALDALASAGIALVVLPATDLYLGGHGEPGTRSLAPWERAIDAGVRVAIANNNIDNPFAPFGNGNLLQAAWLAGITRRGSAPRAGARCSTPSREPRQRSWACRSTDQRRGPGRAPRLARHRRPGRRRAARPRRAGDGARRTAGARVGGSDRDVTIDSDVTSPRLILHMFAWGNRPSGRPPARIRPAGNEKSSG